MALLNPEERFRLRTAVEAAERMDQRLKTDWLLITGAPGSGKSTLVGALANLGWHTIDDPGREEFSAQLEAGISPRDARLDYMAFQQKVLTRAISKIKATPTHQTVFFDYGVAEALAFMKIAGLAWTAPFVEAAASVQFKRVFLLEPIDLVEDNLDPIRTENYQTRLKLEKMIAEIYESLSLPPIHIPANSLEFRLAQVLALLDTE